MSKIVLEIDAKRKPMNDDIIICEENKWIVTSKAQFLNDIILENNRLNAEIVELKADIENLKQGINDKLETYHNILQTLTKEN